MKLKVLIAGMSVCVARPCSNRLKNKCLIRTQVRQYFETGNYRRLDPRCWYIIALQRSDYILFFFHCGSCCQLFGYRSRLYVQCWCQLILIKFSLSMILHCTWGRWLSFIPIMICYKTEKKDCICHKKDNVDLAEFSLLVRVTENIHKKGK